MPVTLADLEITLFDPNTHDVANFDCGDADLNDFLKNDAVKYQHDHLSHTRLVFLNGSLVGYLTLLADSIILMTSEKRRALDKTKAQIRSVFTIPAVKIGRLGIQKEFQRSGVGRQLLIYTVGLVVRINRELNVGVRFITLDAYPASISWYERNHFVFNKHYDRPPKGVAGLKVRCLKILGLAKRNHPSMRYDILKSPKIL